MPVPSRAVLAATSRKAVEAHNSWDSPHGFTILHWDGENLTGQHHVCIMPDIDPAEYPMLMRRAALHYRTECPDRPAYAFLLQVEAYSVTEPGPGASAAVRAQFNADRANRRFHTRPDAFETMAAWCIDIHGRGARASKTRVAPDTIEERFYTPDTIPRTSMLTGLLTIALVTGVADHGQPPPNQGLN